MIKHKRLSHLVSVVVDLHDVYSHTLSDVIRQYGTGCEFERAVIISFCEDAWHQICTCTITELMQIHDCDETIEELINMHASESLNLLFNYFDETQFFDLTHGSVRDYINTLQRPYQPEDYVGEYLDEALYWKIHVFVSTVISRIYTEVLEPLFRHKAIEIIGVAICPSLKNHYRITVELF